MREDRPYSKYSEHCNTMKKYFSYPLGLFILFFLVVQIPSFAEKQETPPPPIDQQSPFANEFVQTTNTEVQYDYWQEFFKMLSILGMIVILLVVSAWFLKRLMSSRMDHMNKLNTIKILERRVLSQKAVLYLLEVPEKKLIVGESPSGLQCLTELPLETDSFAPEEKKNTQNTFEQIMQRKIQKDRV